MAPESNWRPPLATLVAGVVVAAGFVLTGVSWWFLLLCAAGTLGPGLLREVGWLEDRDEFQRLAEYRAGYHAYAISTLVAFGLVAWFRSGERAVGHKEELATLFLTLLWFTWFLSSLFAYWGSRKAAFRILWVFGVVWLVFAIVSNVGNEWTGWPALLLHPLLAAPFFALAWLSKRWPRSAGVLLIAAAAFFAWFFGMFTADAPRLLSKAVTLLLFIGPLVASGVALAFGGGSDESDADSMS